MTQEQRNKKAEQLHIAAYIIETGCEWEIELTGMGWLDSKHINACQWGSPLDAINCGAPIRIKQPAWKLPDPPAGRKWHREDWTQEMLPDGWRPLLYGEAREVWDKTGNVICNRHPAHENKADGNWTHTSTTRPLPKPVIPVPEGWRELTDSEKDGRWVKEAKFLDGDDWGWFGASYAGCYAAKESRIIVPVAKPKKRVPLEPEDVVPGSVVRHPEWKPHSWRSPYKVNEYGMHWYSDGTNGESVPYRTHPWPLLMEQGWLIKRPTDTEWQPAWKLEDEA